ncbi:hypothetical protein ABN034_24115 [Actinopolymorpha sp. B11F2]|uniref:ATP-binding protein n=1 Tax=Actinopolymorpha sp. B11F2 TaxID=3160862 RepID=UPI0032E47F7F
MPALSVPGTRGADADKSPVDRSASRYEALRLFEDRAAAVLPGFVVGRDNQDAVALLCRRLDGLPLAIELAAVQVRVLSVEQILDRLQDRYRLLIRGSRVGPPRHQTLQAAIDWSYALCSATEQALWARCSVFAGDFDLEAVESICVGDDSPEVAVTDVLALVTGLVEKSVLVRDMAGNSARFRLLETIREYGRERLLEAGQEDEFRQRHRDYYLRMASRPMRVRSVRTRPSGVRACVPNGPTSGPRWTSASPNRARLAQGCGWPATCGSTGSRAGSSGTGATGWTGHSR